MLDIDERSQAPALLRLGNDRERERRFPRRFRSKNLDYASARKSANAQGSIDQNIARRNDFDVGDLLIAQSHNGPVPVILGDLLNREVEILVSGGD